MNVTNRNQSLVKSEIQHYFIRLTISKKKDFWISERHIRNVFWISESTFSDIKTCCAVRLYVRNKNMFLEFLKTMFWISKTLFRFVMTLCFVKHNLFTVEVIVLEDVFMVAGLNYKIHGSFMFKLRFLYRLGIQ